jgi:hypothetical protein
MEARRVHTNTVLVLGAGASYPYGFPLGTELYDQVISTASGKYNRLFQQILGSGSGEKLQEFKNALASSGWESVDAFLSTRKDYLEIGKVAIATLIMEAERKSLGQLFTTDTEKKGKWYKQLRSLILFNPEKYKSNNLSIITFNYDRSLEYFLHCAMKYSFNLNDTETAKILSAVPIIHIHGQLGRMPWDDKDNGREYGGEVTADVVRKYADHILIMSEEITGRDGYEQAMELLRETRNLYFLGFGYADINLRRIIGDIRNAVNIAGTAIGFSTLERKRIEAPFGGRGRVMRDFIQNQGWPRTEEQLSGDIGIHLAPDSMNIYDFLRNFIGIY